MQLTSYGTSQAASFILQSVLHAPARLIVRLLRSFMYLYKVKTLTSTPQGTEWLPKSLLTIAFLVSGRWFNFHFKMSSQQFAAEPLSIEDTVLHDKDKNQTHRTLFGKQGKVIVIVVMFIPKFLERHSKANSRAPAYSRALRPVRGIVQKYQV